MSAFFNKTARREYLEKLFLQIWDCTIEHYAFTTACSGKIDTTKYTENKGTFKSKACNDTVKTKELLKTWWDEAKKQDLAASQDYKADIQHFGPMAADTGKGFACTYAACKGSESTLHCVYDVAMTVGQGTVYTGADPADVCKCDNHPDKCVNHLCQYDYTPVQDIPERQCDDGMNGDLQAIAVDMHNYYRRLSATGWAKDAKDGYAPVAKAMPALTYDCTQGANKVAAKTALLVKDCPAAPATGNMPGYALNYHLSKYNLPREQVLREAIKSWAEQVSTVGVGKDNIFTDGAAYTQYANMLNDNAKTFACSVESCPKNGKSAIACQYDATPAADDPIYVIGKQPCKCTAPLTCSNLGGLCVAANP
ncbi:hypothetical protein Aduo_000230 [Ancylostoma duodenale]